VLERRNPVADDLGRFRRHSGSNRGAHFDQSAAGGFRDAVKVLLNAFRGGATFRRRRAIAGFPFFHAGNVTRDLRLKSMTEVGIRLCGDDRAAATV